MSWLDEKCLPGDMMFDGIFGGNQSGMFPDESGVILGEDSLMQVTYSHDCNDDSWSITVDNEWTLRSNNKGVIEVIDVDGSLVKFKVTKDKNWNKCNLGTPVCIKEI